MKLIQIVGALMVIALIIFGTWPIVLGKDPVKPLVEPEVVEGLLDRAGEVLREVELD